MLQVIVNAPAEDACEPPKSISAITGDTVVVVPTRLYRTAPNAVMVEFDQTTSAASKSTRSFAVSRVTVFDSNDWPPLT